MTERNKSWRSMIGTITALIAETLLPSKLAGTTIELSPLFDRWEKDGVGVAVVYVVLSMMKFVFNSTHAYPQPPREFGNADIDRVAARAQLTHDWIDGR